MDIYTSLERLSLNDDIPVADNQEQFIKFIHMSKYKLFKRACSKSDYILINILLPYANKPYKGAYHAAKHGDMEIVDKLLKNNIDRVLEGAIKNGNRKIVELITTRYPNYDIDYATIVAHAYKKIYLIGMFNHRVPIDVSMDKYIMDNNIHNSNYIRYLMMRRDLTLKEAVVRACIKHKLPFTPLENPTKIIRYAVKKGVWKDLYIPHLLGHFLAAFLRFHMYHQFFEMDDGISFTPDFYHSARLGSDIMNTQIASERYQLDWHEVFKDAISNGGKMTLDQYYKKYKPANINDYKLDSIEGREWLVDNNYL